MKKTKEEMTNKVIRIVAEKLNEAINLFVSNMRSDSDWNETLLNSIHEDWKKEAVRMNTIQKLVKFDHNDFKIALGEKMNQFKTKEPKKKEPKYKFN